MLKSSKSNNFIKKRAKSSTTKTKKNNAGNLRNLKNTKLIKVKEIKKTTKSSYLKDKSTPTNCTASIPNQLSLQTESSLEIEQNKVCNQENTGINLLQNEKNLLDINNSNISLSRSNNCYSNAQVFPIKRNSVELFNLIYTEQVALTLPNRSWSIHYTEIPIRSIVVSQVTFHNDSALGFVPHYTKQIIFYEKMNYDIFLFNSKASVKNLPSTMETIGDVTHIIDHTNNLKLCSGGPEVSLYGSVNLECAYKDNKERWRHNLCSLEVSEGDTCKLCLSLESVLLRLIKRNKQSLKPKNVSSSGKRKRTS